MDRSQKYNPQIVEPPVLIPSGYINISDAVKIVSKVIKEDGLRISGCSPAEHYLRNLLSQQAVEALLQHHTDGRCEPMPYQAWAEPAAPMVFEDGMVPIGGLYSHCWASVRINEAQLRDELAKIFGTITTELCGGAKIEVRALDNLHAEAKIETRSGMAGRPTSKHLIMLEAQRRCEEGSVPGSQAAFAESLSSWLRTEHPGEPQASPKAIRNNPEFRALHNAYKASRGPA
jgi:hypothetical protein